MKPEYVLKYLVEYTICPDKSVGFRTYTAKFTNEQHARKFFKKVKKDGVHKVKMFLLDDLGARVKEMRPK